VSGAVLGLKSNTDKSSALMQLLSSGVKNRER
jgi:hypothetical protein